MERIAFLNGELGFHDGGHERFFNKLNSEGKEVMLFDNLFNQPDKISQLNGYDAIVVGTVGFETDKIQRLFGRFKFLAAPPMVVVFAPDEEHFISMANDMKGLTYYRLNYLDLTLTYLQYLNSD